MSVQAQITQLPQVNEIFTVVDKEYGQLTLNAWMVKEIATSKNFVVKGIISDYSSAKDIKVFATVDQTYLKREEYGEYIVVKLDDAKLDDIQDNEKQVKVNADGIFRFNVSLYVDSQKFMDSTIFDIPRRIRLKLNVRTKYSERKWCGLKSTVIDGCFENKNERWFDIFVMKSLENTKTWVGLDPGTSGSCACIGTGRHGSIYEPNISDIGGGIIPSCVIIPQSTISKSDVSSFVPGQDYLYGLRASQMWQAESDSGSACFVSIKKLLGYNKQKKIPVLMSDQVQEFSGVDIAHLLIKGIDNEIQNAVSNFDEKDEERYFSNQKKETQRLVVAIPNNYTLPKTLDMVESVRRTGRYSEIRCIYEPEAILFNYIMKEYSQILKKDGECVMVFDMGGATINASIYKIGVATDGDNTRVNVKTLGRIGYAVGGDNIDFALMETLLDIYTFSRTRGNISNEAIREFELNP